MKNHETNMKKSTIEDISNDFLDTLNQIDTKPADEIELSLQKIIQKIRPLIHRM